MEPEERKKLRKRAKRKVFGRVGNLCERARRFYTRTLRHNPDSSESKMKFFNEALKTGLWFGLMARTSKISPRHTRLTLMYLYISVHLIFTTTVFQFEFQNYVQDFIPISIAVIAA